MSIFRGQMKEGSVGSIKLDLNDRKIFYELGKNGRFSSSRIAKAVGLSREVVAYRLKRMQDAGFYVGATALIDPIRIGWTKHAIYLQLQHHTKEDEKRLIDGFLAHPNIIWIGLCSGDYDIGLLTVTKGNNEFYELFNEISTMCGNCLGDYLILDLVKEDFLGVKIMFDGEEAPSEKKIKPDNIAFEKEFRQVNPTERTIILDETDKKILNELIADARIELVRLSEKVGASVETVRTKIARLIRERVIFGFMALSSPYMLGYSWHIVHLRLKNLTPQEERKLIYHFRTHPNILWYEKTIGRWNLKLNVWIKDSMHFKMMMDELRTNFQNIIADYSVVPVLGQLKYVARVE